MKLKHLLILVCSLSSLFLFSCNQDDDSDCNIDLPECNCFDLFLLDTMGQFVIGVSSQQEKYKFSNNENNSIIELFDSQNSIRVFYNQLVSGRDYYLDLSDTDRDTFQFNFSRIDYKCYKDYEMFSLKFNGKDVYEWRFCIGTK